MLPSVTKEVGMMTTVWNALRDRRALLIVVGAVLTVGLGTSACQSAQATKTTNQVDISSKSLPAGFTEFRIDQAGFELAYPASWTKLSPKDAQIILLASQGPQDSFLVRASELQEPIGLPQLPAARKITDEIVTSNKTVKMLSDPKQVQLGGLPGFFYLYSFQDPSTQQEGVHSHFFLFNGKTMLSMVFQSIPRENFSQSAKTFDQIAASFHAIKK
jgi:hypothetical protein